MIPEQGSNLRGRQALLDAVDRLHLPVRQTLEALIRAHPQGAILRFRERSDPARSQAADSRETVAIEHGKTCIASAGPEIPPPVCEKRAHIVAGKAFAPGVSSGCAIQKLVQAVLSGYPQTAFAVLANREYGVLRESVAIPVAFDGAIFHAAESIARADPDMPVLPARQRKDHIVIQAILGGVKLLLAI